MENTWNGFSKPTTTPVPDELFDIWLSELSGSELKVLLYIVRRTFGFKKDDDAISLTQICSGITTREGRVLDRGTGLARITASKAVKKLEASGLIIVERSQDESGENEVNTYRLRFRNIGNGDGNQPKNQPPDKGSSKNEPGVVRKSNHPGKKISPPVVRKSHPQQTALQETESQQTDGQETEDQSPAPPPSEQEPLKSATPARATPSWTGGADSQLDSETMPDRPPVQLTLNHSLLTSHATQPPPVREERKRAVDALIDFGVWRAKAEQLVDKLELSGEVVERARAVLDKERQRGAVLANPAAVLVARLESGWEPPAEPLNPYARWGVDADDDEEMATTALTVDPRPELPPVVTARGTEHNAYAWFAALKSELQIQIVRETYDTWIRPARLVDYQPSVDGQPPRLTIWLHNLYARAWIQQRLHKVIKRIVDRQLDADVTINYQAPSPDGAHDTVLQVA